MKGIEPPLTITTPNKRLKITDSNGKTIYEEFASGKPYKKPGIRIWKVSMKAKDQIKKTGGKMEEVQDAIGTPDSPTGHGMLVTQEYKDFLQNQITASEAKVQKLKDGVKNGTAKQKDLDAEKGTCGCSDFSRRTSRSPTAGRTRSSMRC